MFSYSKNPIKATMTLPVEIIHPEFFDKYQLQNAETVDFLKDYKTNRTYIILPPPRQKKLILKTVDIYKLYLWGKRRIKKKYLADVEQPARIVSKQFKSFLFY